jgi:hypothetical protein
MPSLDSMLNFASDPVSSVLGRSIDSFIPFFPLGMRRQVRDSHYAGRTFFPNYGDLLVPQPKFLFAVRFFRKKLENPTIGPIQPGKDPAFVAKAMDRPKLDFGVEELNQYNKPRLVHTKVKYGDTTIRFHESVDGRVLDLIKDYYRFYYGDSSLSKSLSSFRNDVIASEYATDGRGWGYAPSLEIKGTDQYFFSKVVLYNFFGGMYDSITLVHPKIVSFDHDSNDASDGTAGTEIKMTLKYEGIIYESAEELEGSEIATVLRFDPYFADYVETSRYPRFLTGRMASLARMHQNFQQGIGMVNDALMPVQMFAPLIPGPIGQTAGRLAQSTSAIASFGSFAFNTAAVGTAAAGAVMGSGQSTGSNMSTVSSGQQPIRLTSDETNASVRWESANTPPPSAANYTTGP